MNVLLIDSGNSRLKICLATHEHLLAQLTLETAPLLNLPADELHTLLKEKIRAFNHKHLNSSQTISQCLIASVTPLLDAGLNTALQEMLHCPVLFVPHQLPVPLDNMYEEPDKLGIDRLVGCFGATKIYPYESLIAVDFGTAITFDCVHNKTFYGGLIAPGLHTAYEGLLNRASKIPLQELQLKDLRHISLMGTNTQQCLQGGFLHGFTGMVESLIYKMAVAMQQRFQLVEPPIIIASGGAAAFFAQHIQTITFTNEHLILEGLRLLLQHQETTE